MRQTTNSIIKRAGLLSEIQTRHISKALFAVELETCGFRTLIPTFKRYSIISQT
jgi:hypothetical protein